MSGYGEKLNLAERLANIAENICCLFICFVRSSILLVGR